MPLKFWDDAFITATFLINLLPTKVLNFPLPPKSFFKLNPTMSLYVFLVVRVGPISVLTTNTNSPFVLNVVCSLVIALVIKE
jgi:hypothetical protein